ncbi:hypothetical protein [Actinoplanes derwentensis]|uniref:UDP-N-acetylglucosamine:LPS N-acetylglucosamine transferase n=1 Tax=Actinoplanes derwentensis TaxID=113562 RepID=A0A1H1YPF8_9ACTN|nr:hypothetical protein [Actinoplanes derwentensis]GID81233.1 hypothetical protein Ade03nite_01570 [Actinoplanes derwentensis]SDT23358.1 hypothetical protein SAMN04489716_2942 [Actinoplanes derwentensis]
MIVCYAQGGGLGHLTRIRAYLHTVHAGEPATLLTTSPFAADPRVLGPHRLLHGDPATVLHELKPSLLVVDAFPGGLTGELTAGSVPPGTNTVHLARLLRWDAYRPLLPQTPIRFDRTWLLEDLEPAHRAHLTGETAPLTLTDPPAPALPDLAPDSWLVLHSGPASEIHELLSYARECAEAERLQPRLVLAAPVRPADLPADVEHVDPYPAWPLFFSAARIVTAAGFNAVRQTARWRSKHLMLPFPRRWDDQFTRAARARVTGRRSPGGEVG